MQRTQLPSNLQQLLRTVPYATIATVCTDGSPWSTPIFACFDRKLSMVWASWPGNQHSQNIARDSRIFVTVFDSHAPAGEGLGLYLQMRAHMLILPAEVHAARKVYSTKFGENLTHEPFLGNCVRRLYWAKPEKIWLNTAGTHKEQFVDVRRPLYAA